MPVRHSRQVRWLHKSHVHNAGREGLVSWFKSTWLPYIERVPEDLRMDFIDEVVDRYITAYPLDDKGYVHVGMVRLEVEAEKSCQEKI